MARNGLLQWTGVVCSNRTSHVITLKINSQKYSTAGAGVGVIGGEIRSSLLTLRHLKRLNLAENDFGGEPIPEFIGALGSLTHLLLSYSNFGGRIPPHLGNLSNLITLHINNYFFDPQISQLISPHLAWVSRLWKLQDLSMAGVDLSTAVDWVDALSMLPSLTNLLLSSCGLSNTMPPPLHSNLTSLEILDLSYNMFNTLEASFFVWGLPSLQHLAMVNCSIHGPFPDAIGNLTSLEEFLLYRNHVTGTDAVH